MIDLVKRSIGLRLFLIFSAVLCLCIAFVVIFSARYSRDFGELVIDENESYVITQALNFLTEITEQRAHRYEAVFQKLSAYSRLIASQAELRLHLAGTPPKQPPEVAKALTLYPPNGIFYTDLSAPATICYWGGASIPAAVAGEINLLAPLAPVLAEAKESNPEVVASHLIMTSGTGHYYPNVEAVFLLPPVSELDLRDTNNYVLANPRNNPERKTVWVPVYFDDVGNGLITTVTSPIYGAEGAFLGVAGLDIPLKTIHEQILKGSRQEAELASKGLISFLLDGRGKIISFPLEHLERFGIEPDADAFDNSFDLLNKGLMDSALPEVRALATSVFAAAVQTSRFSLLGEPYIVSSRLLPANGWRLVNVIPEASFLAPINAIADALSSRVALLKGEFYLTVSLFMVASLLLIIFFLKRFFLWPLKQMTVAAEQIKEGNLDSHLAIERVDEIGTLAKSFNVMAESLRRNKVLERNYAQELESRVAAQTCELERQKETLEQALLVLEEDNRRRQLVVLEINQAREAAEAANQAKSNFLANMTHELRTPLVGVLGMNELLLQTRLDERQRDLADTVQRSGETLLAMISDILDFSKIEAGHLSLKSEEVDLATVVEEATRLLSGKAVEKGLSLELQVAPAARCRVLADQQRLRQILLNLVSNAVKFTERGKVVVRLDRLARDDRSGRFILEVEDSGIGMRPEDRERIFAPFVQIDSTATRAFGGTGLGLTIVRQLVALMGGELVVDSRIGAGSCFRVEATFPLVACQPPECSASLPGADQPTRLPEGGREPGPGRVAGLRPGRILVADDYLVTRKLVCQFLAADGLIIDQAASGREVLELAENFSYGLILMDCNMPGMDGMETTRLLRARGCLAPIVALTAHVDSRIHEECREAGMNDFLSKPFRRQDLITMVDKWLSVAGDALSGNAG